MADDDEAHFPAPPIEAKGGKPVTHAPVLPIATPDSVKRDHRAAIKAGAPSVPRGYFWTTLSEGGFSLTREIPPTIPGTYKQRFVGELDKDGNWQPIHGETFNPLNPKSAARKASRSKAAEFRIPDPLPERSGSPLVKPRRTRPLKPSPERSGEFQLPEIQNVQWEWNLRGGAEAYYAPEGATKRSDKTYLVYIGLRKLNGWKQQSQTVLERNVLNAVEQARKEKGV